MATNKHAIIRYQALDKCFRSTFKRYAINDLLDSVNEALYEYTGSHIGVQKRQLYDDINFMQSEQGWNVEIEKYKEGRFVYYRYLDANFSINSEPLNQAESDQLKEALLTLGRFKGMPQFEWVDEMITRLTSSFNLENNGNTVIEFEENLDLVGKEHISDFYHAIVNNQVQQLTYQGFRQITPMTFNFHPYYLKQYNNRWFVFGWNENVEKIANVALDRVLNITTVHVPFKITEINFQEYFEEIIGVSVPEDQIEQKIVIRVEAGAFNYIKTKPLHGTQKLINKTDNYIDISIEVIPNYELESLLLQHGEAMEVIAPEDFRVKFSQRVKALNKKYF